MLDLEFFMRVLFRLAEVGFLVCCGLYVILPAGATTLGAWAIGADLPRGETLLYVTIAWVVFHALIGLVLWHRETE